MVYVHTYIRLNMKLKKKINCHIHIVPSAPQGLSVFLPGHLVTLQGAKDREELTSGDAEGTHQQLFLDQL